MATSAGAGAGSDELDGCCVHQVGEDADAKVKRAAGYLQGSFCGGRNVLRLSLDTVMRFLGKEGRNGQTRVQTPDKLRLKTCTSVDSGQWTVDTTDRMAS